MTDIPTSFWNHMHGFVKSRPLKWTTALSVFLLLTTFAANGKTIASSVGSETTFAPVTPPVMLTPAAVMPGVRPLSSGKLPASAAAAVTTGNLVEEADVFIDELAKDTWFYLSSDWATDNHLPWSWRSASVVGGDYANPAEIGFYALAWLAAYEMNRSWGPDWATAAAEITAVLDQLRSWQTGSQSYQPHGPNAYGGSVFYQWYWINWPSPVVGGNAADHLVPVIDNAWLAASLITIREYAEARGATLLAQKSDAILSDMDFTRWYHFDTHRFTWGDVEDPGGGSQADYYSNENRIINFIAYALGQLSAAEFQLSLEALNQPSAVYQDTTVEKVAWDGSYFTYAGPALFIREMDSTYGERTIGPATQAQIEYAQDQGYLAWGLSDAYDVAAGGYIQQGAPPIAGPGPLETKPGVISPHASALALITPFAAESIANLKTISNTFPLSYVPDYGFLDSVMAKPGDPQFGVASDRFSVLNQEWLFLSLVNSQTGFIWNTFYRDEGVFQAHVTMYGQRVYLPFVPSPPNP